jgi:hypothetical protein
VTLANENLLATGIEDFIANQISSNFIESEDTLLNIGYLNVIARTHTPVVAKPDNDGGVYNLCTYMGNVLTSYGIFMDFVFSPDGLTVVIEKKKQTQLDIDTGLANVTNLSEIYEAKALAKLTVLWNNTTKHFFLKTDRTITEDMTDPDRAKGYVDVLVLPNVSEAVMREVVLNKFKANSYQHKVSLDVIPSKLILAADLYVGHKCRVKTGSGIKDSIITAIEHSKDTTAISVTLGQMKVTLIEKLKGVETQ